MISLPPPPIVQPPYLSSALLHEQQHDEQDVEDEANQQPEKTAVKLKLNPIILNPPQASLYISNIDWSIKKPQLKRSLYSLFSRHGRVLDVILLRGCGLAGQAFVLFDSVQTATTALEAEQGFLMYDRPLQINYTKEKSDRVSKREGTYVPIDRKEKRLKRQQQFELTQRMKQLEKDEEAEDDIVAANSVAVPVSDDAKVMLLPQPFVSTAAIPQMQHLTHQSAPPSSNILFAEKLPLNCNELMLSILFRQHPGFQEVRIPRPGIAFIEYQLPSQAESAMQALQGCKLTENDTLALQFSVPQ